MRKLKDHSFTAKVNIAGKETTIHHTVTNIFQGDAAQKQALQSQNLALEGLLKQATQLVKASQK